MIRYDIKLAAGAKLPARAHDTDSGYDLVALGDPKIVGDREGTGWRRIDYLEYRTGIQLSEPRVVSRHPLSSDVDTDAMWSLLFPRSSVSKYNLVLANSVGVIDHSYRGELLLRFKYIWQPADLYCDGDGHLTGTIDGMKIYGAGDKIAQLVPVELLPAVSFNVVDAVAESARGAGGFGSSGS